MFDVITLAYIAATNQSKVSIFIFDPTDCWVFVNLLNQSRYKKIIYVFSEAAMLKNYSEK